MSVSQNMAAAKVVKDLREENARLRVLLRECEPLVEQLSGIVWDRRVTTSPLCVAVTGWQRKVRKELAE